MKAEKFRDLTDDELEARIKEAKAELFNLRFQLATGQLDNPKRIKEIKKDIARIQTIRREREIEVKLASS
ncbi:MAG TPA: 50S ribosomal protein L29 [Candidatus Aquicultor sp.]